MTVAVNQFLSDVLSTKSEHYKINKHTFFYCRVFALDWVCNKLVSQSMSLR